MSSPAAFLTIIASLTLGLAAAPAAGSSEKAAKPARHLRMIPVGDSPPFMHEVRDGVSHEIDPPAGELPPTALVARHSAAADAKTRDTPPPVLPLHLNRISQAVSIPDGAGPLAFDRAHESPAAAPWLEARRPETGDLLLLLWRDPKEKSWNKASHMIVPDGPAGTPVGMVRFINTFPSDLLIHWGDEKLRLKQGATFTRSIRPGSDVAFEILSSGPDGRAIRYYSNQITQNPGERGFIIIYRADGESPRRPLKVIVLREPATAPARNERPENTGK